MENFFRLAIVTVAEEKKSREIVAHSTSIYAGDRNRITQTNKQNLVRNVGFGCSGEAVTTC